MNHIDTSPYRDPYLRSYQYIQIYEPLAGAKLYITLHLRTLERCIYAGFAVYCTKFPDLWLIVVSPMLSKHSQIIPNHPKAANVSACREPMIIVSICWTKSHGVLYESSGERKTHKLRTCVFQMHDSWTPRHFELV